MKLLTPFLFAMLAACGAAPLQEKKLPVAKESPLETIKEQFRYSLENNEDRKLSAASHFLATHSDEILKTLEVSEVDSIPGKDIVLAFFRYSVGSEIAHSSFYFKKMDGKYYTYHKYFSLYDDDPFGNGKGVEGKALLKRLEEWNAADKNIWWK